MSLVRVWRRQLFGASTAALIVPSAMLAALAVLALGGGFGSVGMLGQLFVGPSLPGVAPGSSGGFFAGSHGRARMLATASLPVVPAVAPGGGPRQAAVHPAPAGHRVPAVGPGASSAGGAIGGSGGTVRPVTSGGSGSGSRGGSGSGGLGSGGGSPSGSSPPPNPAPSPRPSPPPPQPTPVDTVVKVVTSVTQQLPAPVGPVATQTVQAAGPAVDNLLPQTGQPAPVPFVPGSPAGGLTVP